MVLRAALRAFVNTVTVDFGAETASGNKSSSQRAEEVSP